MASGNKQQKNAFLLSNCEGAIEWTAKWNRPTAPEAAQRCVSLRGSQCMLMKMKNAHSQTGKSKESLRNLRLRLSSESSPVSDVTADVFNQLPTAKHLLSQWRRWRRLDWKRRMLQTMQTRDGSEAKKLWFRPLNLEMLVNFGYRNRTQALPSFSQDMWEWRKQCEVHSGEFTFFFRAFFWNGQLETAVKYGKRDTTWVFFKWVFSLKFNGITCLQ